jgi:hypothetical protein
MLSLNTYNVDSYTTGLCVVISYNVDSYTTGLCIVITYNVDSYTTGHFKLSLNTGQ